MRTTTSRPARPHLLRDRLVALLSLAGLVAALSWSGTAAPSSDGAEPPSQGADAMNQSWQQVETLIDEQKLRAALDATAQILERAQAEGADDDWTRALVTRTQLQSALGEAETAVEDLLAAPRPDDARSRAIVDLYAVHSLVGYLRTYGWEIRQREAIAAAVDGDALDLKRWTHDQIVDAAAQRYDELWQKRAAWGEAPLGELAEYLQQNNYPPRIRGTLRDAISYLYVEFLVDSSLWPVAVHDEVEALPLDALLTPGRLESAESADGAVSTETLHPLQHAVAVLGDLEGWHNDGRRPEAAYEAYRSRSLRLESHRGEAREQILAAHAERLDALGSRWPWWSFGTATQAEMLRRGEDPQRLVEARELASAAARAHPDSAGAQKARHLVASIEAPSYTLDAMRSDGIGERSIRVRHKNLDRLHFRAYRLDLWRQVRGAKDYNLLPSGREIDEILDRDEPTARWSVDLPPTPDYQEHDTYVTPPDGAPGLYVVVASAREDFRATSNRRTAVHLILGDVVLIVREQWPSRRVTVTARSGATGETLAGATVHLVHFNWQHGHQPVARQVTDAGGRTTFELPKQGVPYFLLAEHGDDVALEPSQRYRWSDGVEATERTGALVSTDRPIYRPAQTVRWKVVAYRGTTGRSADETRFQTAPGQPLTVTLHDANGEVVETIETTTNDFGSAAGEVVVPPGRLLGLWRLQTSLGGSTPIRVEEYKRPTFEVDLLEPDEAMRLGRTATFAGSARYYFGLPVSDGAVRWRVTREPVWPTWWWGGWRGGSSTRRLIASGTTSLDADGRFELEFLPEPGRSTGSGPAPTFRFRIEADVVDAGGETRSAERTVRLGEVAVEATVTPDAGYVVADTESSVQIVRRDLDGTPRAGVGHWRLVRIEQPAETPLPADLPPDDRLAPAHTDDDETAPEEASTTPGDLLRPRWQTEVPDDAILRHWPDGETVASGRVEHSDDGEARVALPGLAPGAYRLRYATDDAWGSTFTIDEAFLVIGDEAAADAASAIELPLVVESLAPSVEVGDSARILVATGLADQPLDLELFHRGHSLRRWTETAGSGGLSRVVEIPIDDGLRGGFSLTVHLLRDHQLVQRTVDIVVPWTDRRLDVSFATFRDRLRPGATERWIVTVRDPEGAALGASAAEVLALMYDRSLDVFAAYSPPDPLGLYPGAGGAPGLGSTLGHAGIAWQGSESWFGLPGDVVFTGDRLAYLPSLGIGGPGRMRRLAKSMPAAPAPMAMRSEAADMAAESLPLEPSDSVALLAEEAVADASVVGGNAEAPEATDDSGLRSDFSETAFFEPQLLTDADGEVSFAFTVPDAVTEWNVWAHAVTRDLRGGSVQRTTQSVKELLVRPNLPRFLREGDRAVLRVRVDNSGEAPLEGTVRLTLESPDDAEIDVDLNELFGLPAEGAVQEVRIEPGAGSVVEVPLTAPRGALTVTGGLVAIKVTAVAQGGDQVLSDGELRPLPILPSRLHLVQSRFAALADDEREILRFDQLAAQASPNADPTLETEQLVVTLDGQLFLQVLEALPYLVDYPYECTEQTLNRFVSTAIVSSVFADHPALAGLAATLAERTTRTPAWTADDPNRRIQLVESPWLEASRGGRTENLIPVLDPEIASAHRSAAMRRLEQSQTSLGAFPWFPGGPPSPYMTLYILHGLSKVLEHEAGGEVSVPRPLVQNAWRYLHRHWVDELARKAVEDDCCWQMVTFLGYVLSAYPEDGENWTGGVFSADDRRLMLDHSFRHWREHPPLLKAQLALTLHRAGRADDARLVFDSLMDSARTDDDLGTYWAPEDRSWLWYNDTVEGHAFALRALIELSPDDARRHGLAQWLFLDKQLGHWKSTRATAEAIWALSHYLDAEGQLGAAERATVTVGPLRREFSFDPADLESAGELPGKEARVLVPGDDVIPSMGTIEVTKDTPGLLFASATWHFSTETLPSEAEGDLFRVERRVFERVLEGDEWTLRPLADGTVLEPGDQVEVQLSISARHAAEYVHLRDPRAAGFEPESLTSGYRWQTGLGYYEEIRDSGTNFFFDWLPAGEYTLRHRLRATVPGTFRLGPATLQSLYAPEFTAYSAGQQVAIDPGE
ncbi:MAG: alpha-2-macroglobulin family protein [Acidobacteriota bacterium]